MTNRLRVAANRLGIEGGSTVLSQAGEHLLAFDQGLDLLDWLRQTLCQGLAHERMRGRDDAACPVQPTRVAGIGLKTALQNQRIIGDTGVALDSFQLGCIEPTDLDRLDVPQVGGDRIPDRLAG